MLKSMQKTTVVSTAEAEHYSAPMAGCKVLYLQALLHSLGFAQKKPTPVYEDNTACIEWGNNVIGGHEGAKLTSGSASPTKSSRMVRCGWSGFQSQLRWPTS